MRRKQLDKGNTSEAALPRGGRKNHEGPKKRSAALLANERGGAYRGVRTSAMNTAMLMIVARGPVASRRVAAVRARIHCHASRRAGNATTAIPTDKGAKPGWTLPCITSMRPPVSPY